MSLTDWRAYATEAAQREFADAQYRLDHLNTGEDSYTAEQHAADEKVANRYDRLVLQPAHDEFEHQRDEDEFNHHYPEPADESRIEFEFDRGARYGAYRMDVPEREGGTWWMYGADDEPRSWRELVCEFELRMDDVVVLVPAGEEGR